MLYTYNYVVQKITPNYVFLKYFMIFCVYVMFIWNNSCGIVSICFTFLRFLRCLIFLISARSSTSRKRYRRANKKRNL